MTTTMNGIKILSRDHKIEIHPSAVDGEFALVHDGEVYADHLSCTTARKLGISLVQRADRVARAAEHVDATELSDGRWAHHADETQRWYIVTEDDLESLCDYLDSDDNEIAGNAYSHWCAGTTTSEEMPAGWTPDDDA